MVVTALVLAGNAVLLAGLAIVGWRNRGLPGARWFAALQAVSAVWALLTIAGLMFPPGVARLRLWGVVTGLSLVVTALWLAFILSYTGRDRWLRARRFGPVIAPLVAGAAVYIAVPTWGPLVGDLEQVRIPAGTVVQSSIGPVGGLLGAYIYATFAGGFVVVGWTVIAGNRLFLGQALALVLGSLATVAASLGAVAGLPVRGYPLIQVALGPQALLWGYAVFREELLGVVPAVARIGERTLVDELDDGLLVVDGDGRVLQANPRAHQYLGAEDLAGRDVGTVLGGSGDGVPNRIERRGRTYQVTESTVTGPTGDAVGRALVLRDVTDLVQRQQRLEVLNRVLRHNVRNSMTAVLGAADRLQEGADDTATLGRVLDENARTLTRISEKALSAERALEGAPAEERLALGEFVRDLVEQLADQYPDADVSVSADGVTVRTDRRLLTLVCEEAVENALQHAGDAPTVSVTVSADGDRAVVTVADDGPGIPAAELDPIRAGEETDLEHASSLGLWLVHWAARSLGADLDISTTGGSTVTLSLPASPPESPTAVAAAADPQVRADGQ